MTAPMTRAELRRQAAPSTTSTSPRRRPLTRLAAIAAVTAVAAIAGMTAASALWSDDDSVTIGELPLGNAAFAVSDHTPMFGHNHGSPIGPLPGYQWRWATETAPGSNVGQPLFVTVPGATIAEVLTYAPAVFPEHGEASPWFWTSFNVYGRADGPFGWNYDVTPVAQVVRGGSHLIADDVIYDLTDGVGAVQTLLGNSTMVVFPSPNNADCAGNRPGFHSDGRNVYAKVSDGSAPANNVPLRESVAGSWMYSASTPDRLRQLWCVGVTFNHIPDGRYVADAMASGVGINNQEYEAEFTDYNHWWADIAYAAGIPAVGIYSGSTVAEGEGRDNSIHRDRNNWWAFVTPDPANEPDLVLQVTPRLAVP